MHKLFYLICIFTLILFVPYTFSQSDDGYSTEQDNTASSYTNKGDLVANNIQSDKGVTVQLSSTEEFYAVRVFDVYLDIGIFTKTKIMYA